MTHPKGADLQYDQTSKSNSVSEELSASNDRTKEYDRSDNEEDVFQDTVTKHFLSMQRCRVSIILTLTK